MPGTQVIWQARSQPRPILPLAISSRPHLCTRCLPPSPLLSRGQATDHIDCDDLDKDMPDAGFSSHMSLTGSLYLWPFFCDLLSSFN